MTYCLALRLDDEPVFPAPHRVWVEHPLQVVDVLPATAPASTTT